MKAKGVAAHRGWRCIRHQRIARCATQALANAVDAAQHQDHQPGTSQAQQRPGNVGERIACHRQPLASATHDIRMPPRPELDQTRCRVGNALDKPQGNRPCGQHRRQQDGNKRYDDIGGEIVEETDQAENDYSAW
jgi:hypothetical protein